MTPPPGYHIATKEELDCLPDKPKSLRRFNGEWLYSLYEKGESVGVVDRQRYLYALPDTPPSGIPAVINRKYEEFTRLHGEPPTHIFLGPEERKSLRAALSGQVFVEEPTSTESYCGMTIVPTLNFGVAVGTMH